MAQPQSLNLQEDYDSCLDDIAEAKEILKSAYAPESTREDLAKAIREALDIFDGYESEEETEEEDELD